MPVKVQGDNGKYGCGIGVAQQGFEVFFTHHMRSGFDSRSCH